MKLKANKVTKLLSANIERQKAYITVLDDITLYLLKYEAMDMESYEDNGFPLKQYGVHEVEKYTGELFVMAATACDVRVIEY